jgi:hypothetical protein
MDHTTQEIVLDESHARPCLYDCSLGEELWICWSQTNVIQFCIGVLVESVEQPTHTLNPSLCRESQNTGEGTVTGAERRMF